MSASAKRKSRTTMAEQADLHELYEEAVQAVDVEVEFLEKTFKELRGREAESFREDFCGTASAACQWVKGRPDRFAIGVDNWPEVLDWGRQHRVGRLRKRDRSRVELLLGDVRTVETPPVDIVGAFNFSYYLFKERSELVAYFRRVREALKPDGIFFIDAFGGPEGWDVAKEKTKYDGFTYIWDQAEYEPVTGRMLCHIHFKFPDGSKLKKAFTYDWRVWTLPELRDALIDAGFASAQVYWEGEDEDGEGNGEYAQSDTGSPDPAWIAYVVAEK